MELWLLKKIWKTWINPHLKIKNKNLFKKILIDFGRVAMWKSSQIIRGLGGMGLVWGNH